ncbi:MAG: HAD family phosphatase [Saprospirales bacterium]|nr:MAG: HAD family phosphatase [Saprospirales bacterium]
MKGVNILFDFGNVLIDLDIPKTTRMLEELVADDVEEARREIEELVKKYETGKISTELFINGILKFCRNEVQAKDVIDAWNAMLIGVPARRIEWLYEMKKHHRMAILSNTNSLHLENVYKGLEKKHPGLDFENEFFEKVFYSHQIGLRKPEKECFEYVMKELGWKPEATIFIDDVEENVEAASSLGLTGINLIPELPVEDLIKPGSLVP